MTQAIAIALAAVDIAVGNGGRRYGCNAAVLIVMSMVRMTNHVSANDSRTILGAGGSSCVAINFNPVSDLSARP
jgi:hypothetical protein